MSTPAEYAVGALHATKTVLNHRGMDSTRPLQVPVVSGTKTLRGGAAAHQTCSSTSPNAPSLVRGLSLLGPPLVGTHRCCLGQPHESCRFGGAQTQSTGHNKLVLVRVAHVFTPGHFSNISTTRADCFLSEIYFLSGMKAPSSASCVNEPPGDS